MTTPKDTPAALRRRIAKLEALLAAEKERAELAWAAYRDALYAQVQAEMKLRHIKEVMDEE